MSDEALNAVSQAATETHDAVRDGIGAVVAASRTRPAIETCRRCGAEFSWDKDGYCPKCQSCQHCGCCPCGETDCDWCGDTGDTGDGDA